MWYESNSGTKLANYCETPSYARYILHAFYGFQFADELFESVGILQHDGQVSGEKPVVAVDVDGTHEHLLFLGDDGSDIVDDTHVVLPDNTQGDAVLASALGCPSGTDNTVGSTLAHLWGVGAVGTMNLDAARGRDESEYIVAVDGVAALCQLEIDAFQVLVDYQYITALREFLGVVFLIHHKVGSRACLYGFLSAFVPLLCEVGIEHILHL